MTGRGIITLAAMWLGLACGGERTPPSQPIEFNHKLHLSDEVAEAMKQRKLTCTDCHPGAEKRQHAELPALSVCLRCHMKMQTGKLGQANPEEAKIRELAGKRQRFRWIQVTRNPAQVYFSHRAHVGIGKMTCDECHGDVAEWTTSPRKPEQRLQSMDACMSCHRQRGANNECAVCHR